jgi:hypothetical protein
MAASIVLCFSTEYHNSRQSIIILFWKYLINIRSESVLGIYKWKIVYSAPPGASCLFLMKKSLTEKNAGKLRIDFN